MRVGDRILLWFKKTDRHHRPRIYPTNHALHLERGGQLSLFPDCTILIVGYLLNQDETKVARVSISRPAGRGLRPEWCIDLEPAVDANLKVMSREHSADDNRRFKIVVKKSPVQQNLI
jgi:hypothetical protein